MWQTLSVLAVALMLGSVGCSGPAQPSAPATAPSAAEPPASVPEPSASTEEHEEPKPARRRWVVETQAIPQDIDGASKAPCDFDRSYRGLIGKTPVTIVLRPTGEKLSGLSHYDREGPSLAVSGVRTGAADFALTEVSGGSFQGQCDATGVLRGTFTVGNRTDTFELHPKPREWPGIHRVTRRTQREPNHPICRTRAVQNEAIETSLDGEDYPRIVCLPRNPARRRALLAEAPHLLCTVEDVGYRVFGLGNADVERRANQVLSATEYEATVKAIQPCTGTRSSYKTMTLVAASKDFLSVSGSSSEDFGGVHPMNGRTGSVLVDLVRGASVTLPEIVDVPRLRDVAAACLPIYRLASGGKDVFELPERIEPTTCEADQATMGRFLWGCDKDDWTEPAWSIVREGIVIGSFANPHVSAAMDGRGPIIPWAVLLREGLLKSDSPAKALWSGVRPAPADAPACSSAYEGDVLRRWREQ